MPNTTSAKKALRQTERRHAKNLQKKRTLKGAVKNFKKLAIEQKPQEAAEALKKVYEIADKTAKTGYIKKNKASRIKSRSAKFLERQSK